MPIYDFPSGKNSTSAHNNILSGTLQLIITMLSSKVVVMAQNKFPCFYISNT